MNKDAFNFEMMVKTFRMLQKISFDTEDWSNNDENSSLIKGINYILKCIHMEQQLPALSLKAYTEVTKTVNHRLATGGRLQKGVSSVDKVKMPNFTAEINVYSLVQKVVSVYIANFALH